MARSVGINTAMHPELGKQLTSARRRIFAWLPEGNSTSYCADLIFSLSVFRSSCPLTNSAFSTLPGENTILNSAEPERLCAPNFTVLIWVNCSTTLLVHCPFDNRRVSRRDGALPVSFR